VHLRSRNVKDLAPRFSTIVQALAAMPDETVIDGEIVASDESGRPSFSALQHQGPRTASLYYYVTPAVRLAAGRSDRDVADRSGPPGLYIPVRLYTLTRICYMAYITSTEYVLEIIAEQDRRAILSLQERNLSQRYGKMANTMVVDVSQDWTTACNVQQRFMDRAAPAVDGIGYSARCRQLRALGGDCYDFLPLSRGQLAFAIGDASGKSLPAALMITSVQSSLRTAAFFAGSDPATVIGTVNRQLQTASHSDRFATLFYGVFDSVTSTLSYSNAGHNPPLVIRRDGSVVRLETSGLPVGLFADSTYEEAVVQLQPGDTVIAYTDGVTEAVSPSGEEWGVEGLRKAAVESKAREAEEVVDAIFTSLDEFSRGRQADDATVAILRVH